MSYQWTPGELAVCIRVGNGLSKIYFRVGGIYTVREYVQVNGTPIGKDFIMRKESLAFNGIPDEPAQNGTWGWAPERYRPLNEDDYKRIREKHGQGIEVGNWGALF